MITLLLAAPYVAPAAGVDDTEILRLIRDSIGYKTTVGPTDKSKVDKALAGLPSARPSSLLGRAAWELARRIAAAR